LIFNREPISFPAVQLRAAHRCPPPSRKISLTGVDEEKHDDKIRLPSRTQHAAEWLRRRK